MNIGLYQSAASLSALERWQDAVSQNITSAQNTGYRKRMVGFNAQSAGEFQLDPHARVGDGTGVPALFPQARGSIDFTNGETQPTRRELDVAIQGDGFFEVQMDDGTKAYTRSGEFRMRPDRTLVTSSGYEVLSESGSPIVLLPGNGQLSINHDGGIVQGTTQLGKFAIRKFADNHLLTPAAGGMFLAQNVAPEPVDKPEVLQGYLEQGNVQPLREMVDMVLISRAYEANQKIISTIDQQMQKTLEALG
jgi:flagellar basal-body rod protein FlgF